MSTCATEEQAQQAASAARHAPHTTVLFCVKSSPSSFAQPALQVPSTPVPEPGHWGFLLQELGAGNSKRDWSLGVGGARLSLQERPTSGPAALHWDSSLCPSLPLGQITLQDHVGILVLFYIY